MKSLTVLLLSILAVSACSSSPVERSNGLSQSNEANRDPENPTDEVPEAPAPGPSNAPKNSNDLVASLANAKMEAEGIPEVSSDVTDFDFTVRADASLTHFSYKVASPEGCKSGVGYKVEPISAIVRVNIEKFPDGPVAICLLKYLASGELWQKAENATIISWLKVPFVRTIKSQFVEFDVACNKELVTHTEVKFTGTKGTYSWVRDSRSQGCNQATEEGEDNLSITFSDKNEIRGFWQYNGDEASGWYTFTWKNEERTSFEGVYGYGDPSLEPAGPWDSSDL